MDPVTLLYIAYAILGLGVIIFIHELGHFLAAKKVGVRVDAFAIGFDPPVFGRKLRLFSFKKGETEYIVGLVPLGGYVKMAGETELEAEPRPEGSPPPSDWLIAKPAASRALVFAAGAIFNVISAFLFFMLAFSIGVNLTAPQVGEVVLGAPAWRAGLRPGDEIVAVDGREILDFMELRVAAALRGGGAPVEVQVRRAGSEPPPFTLKPEYDDSRFGGMFNMGIVPVYDSEMPDVTENSPAARAGVEAGDRLVGVKLDGTEIVDPPSTNLLLHVLDRYLRVYPGRPVDLLFDRDGDRRWRTIERRKKDEGRPVLGVIRGGYPQVIELLAPGSDASTFLKPGDRILSINGESAALRPWLTLLSTPVGAPLVLEIESRDGQIASRPVDRQRAVKWFVNREIYSASLGAELGQVEADTELYSQGLRTGDVLVRVGQDYMRTVDQVAALASRQEEPATTADETISIELLRDGRRLKPLEVPRRLLKDARSWPWERHSRVLTMQGNAPAHRLGIEDGSRIVRLGDQETESWDQITQAVAAYEGQEIDIVWQTPAGEKRSGKERIVADAYEELGLKNRHKQVKVQEGLLGATKLGIERSVVTAEWVFLTLKRLATRDVAPRTLSGPIGIVTVIVLVSELGFGTLIYFLAIISINLGILNLLPIPILDGGHLLFLAIEKIKGSPVSVRIQEIATTVAFFLLIGLALFVTWHDVARLIRFW